MNFMGKSFKYCNEKIRKRGFEYKNSAKKSIINGLMALNPEKKHFPTN